MNNELSQLQSLAEVALCSPPSETVLQEFFNPWGKIGKELADLLRHKNGFYCFNSALLVRPYSSSTAPIGMVEWNDVKRWRKEYEVEMSGVLFFAEDLFGGQFCVRDDAIATFDPETGAFEKMCSTLCEWAATILADPEVLTAYPLALDWRKSGLELLPGYRLLPKVPFICEGAYDVENLYPLDDVQGMRYRASIATQIRDVPDGSSIQFTVVPPKPATDGRM